MNRLYDTKTAYRWVRSLHEIRYLSCAAGILAGPSANEMWIGSRLEIVNCYNSGNVTATGLANCFANEIGSVEFMYPNYNTTNGGERQYYTGTMENCYGRNEGITPLALGSAFKADENGINGGYPLLIWQSETVDTSMRTISFAVDPADSTVEVYTDSTREQKVSPNGNGTYSLSIGAYYYRVTKNGYASENGSFTVGYSDKTISVILREALTVVFKVTPINASFVLSDSSSHIVTPESTADGEYSYILNTGGSYSYTSTAIGYNSITQAYIALNNDPVVVTLTASNYDPNASNDKYIYGSGNTDKTSTITTGGTYYVGDGATGTITISTSSQVILVGRGYSKSAAYFDLYIDCKPAMDGANLTIQDLYISNVGSTSSNMIDFSGENNFLFFKGTCLLDQDTNATGYAMIHVNASTELTLGGVSDSDTLYFYKREQAAGIGGNGDASGAEGQTPEYNGKITITGGNIFGKGSKQGAVIGSGADANAVVGTPGDIIIQGGILNLIANARGGLIGGSAGSSGGARGANVYLYDGTLTLNVDWSGAAIGGGGFDSGNDSQGGTLHYFGGSVRTYIDQNAIGQWQVSAPGVNDKAITANKVNGNSNNPVYLLRFNTSGMKNQTAPFTVSEGNNTLYSGGLHHYSYINEGFNKAGQNTLDYTVSNWTSLSDTNLYLYLTGENHTLTVNNEKFDVKWNADSKTFTVTNAAGNPVGGDELTGDRLTQEFGADRVPLSDNPDLLVTLEPVSTNSNRAATAKVTAKEVTDAIAEADKNSKSGIAIAPKGIAANAKSVSVELPTSSVKAISDADLSLVVNTPLGNLTFEGAAVNTIAVGAKGDVVHIIIEAIDTSKLSVGQQKAIGDRPVVDINVESGGEIITNLGNRVIVTIPYELRDNEDSSGLKVFLLTDNGELTEIACTYNRSINSVIFVVSSVSKYVIMYDASAAWVNPFSDVKDTDWFFDAVRFVSARGLMNGTSETTFAPNSNLTRAMLVTILYRYEGEPAVSDNSSFTDVPSGQWYSDAIAWAAANGIVEGVGDDKYSPNGNITREQLATILHRYAKLKSTDVTANGDLSIYLDSNTMSNWAGDAMKWAVGSGIITGTSDTTVNPKGTATRAQVATMLMRMIATIG